MSDQGDGRSGIVLAARSFSLAGDDLWPEIKQWLPICLEVDLLEEGFDAWIVPIITATIASVARYSGKTR
jgi:hypothetical protein